MTESGNQKNTRQDGEPTLTGFTSVVVRFRRLATTGLACAMAAHLAFLVIFWLLDVRLLAAFNLFSTGLYGVCLVMMRHVALRPVVLVLAWLEIMAHATIATLAVGAESGFHYFLIALIPLVFIDPRGHWLTRMVGLAVLAALFTGLDLTGSWHQPWYDLGDQTLALLKALNGLICFASLGTLINVYARSSRKSERELRNLASTDLLTGLCNRRSMVDQARLLDAERRASGSELTVVLVDLDHFKQFNDRYGHALGDDILIRTAGLMQENMRPGDSLARWGGEEFLILLTNTNLEGAGVVAERVRTAIAEQSLEHQGRALSITATLGVTTWHQDESLDTCLSRADEALYRGKQKGRNRTEVA